MVDVHSSTRTLLIAAVALLTGCADATERLDTPERTETVERPSDRGRAIEVDPITAQSLADFLVRAPGVFVDGAGSNARVRLRGRAPLYVIDNVPVGFSYRDANALVIPEDIDQIEVMNAVEAQGFYGSQGANGAIVIRTRR